MSRTGQNIYKRKDGRWEGRCIVDRRADNSAVYRSVYAHTYNEVKAKLEQIKQLPLYPSHKSMLFGEISTQWLNHVKAERKYSTYVKYYNTVHSHILPEFADIRTELITTEKLQNFINRKLLSGCNGKNGLAGATVKGIISVIHSIIRFSADTDAYCPCRFDKLKIINTPNELKVMGQNEYTILSEYLINNLNYFNLGLLMCLFSGIRLGEICALKFDDIADGIIYINKSVQRLPSVSSEKRTELIITPPKTHSSIRYIPLPKFVWELASKLYIKGAYVLTGKSKLLDPRTFQNRFKKILKECNLPDLNVHACRHSFATNCIESGCEVKVLSEILGHSNVSITLNKYVHPGIATKQKAVDAFASVFYEHAL